MRKITKTIAILSVLGMTTVACQKETMIEPQMASPVTDNVYTVQYSIDGQYYSATLSDDAALHDLLRSLCALAKQGYRVSINNGNALSGYVSAKEKIVFETKDEAEMMTWMGNMMLAGYTVTVSYDQTTGVFTGIAEKP